LLNRRTRGGPRLTATLEPSFFLDVDSPLFASRRAINYAHPKLHRRSVSLLCESLVTPAGKMVGGALPTMDDALATSSPSASAINAYWGRQP